MKTCKRCDAPHKNKVFCSRDCHQAWDTEHKAFYEKDCELCGKHFSGGSILKDVRFCSNECARRHTGNVLSSRGRGESSYLDSVRICPVCDEQIPNTRNKRANQRCSVKCDKVYKTNLLIEAWKLDCNFGTAKSGGLKRFIRTYLITKTEGKCSRCGRSDIHPVTGNYVIEVDHIDGDRFNNSPSNLEVLCANCHSLTPTFKCGNARKVSGFVEPEVKKSVEVLKDTVMIKSWLADDSIHNGKDVLPHYVRDFLIAEAGYRCSVASCGWGEVNQFTGRVPLEVDHIDGDAHNNVRKNLRVVCPQCHALSPFHRALNRKSSRVGRGSKSPV